MLARVEMSHKIVVITKKYILWLNFDPFVGSIYSILRRHTSESLQNAASSLIWDMSDDLLYGTDHAVCYVSMARVVTDHLQRDGWRNSPRETSLCVSVCGAADRGGKQ